MKKRATVSFSMKVFIIAFIFGLPIGYLIGRYKQRSRYYISDFRQKRRIALRRASKEYFR